MTDADKPAVDPAQAPAPTVDDRVEVATWPGGDLQRPLDEGWPEDIGRRPGDAGQAVPAQSGSAEVAPEVPAEELEAGAATEAETEAEAEAEAAEGETETEAEAETVALRPAVPVAAAVRSHRATAPLAAVGHRLVRAGHALRLLPSRAARAGAAWARRPSGRLAIPGLLIGVLLLAGGLGGTLVVPGNGESRAAGASPAPTTGPVTGATPTAPPFPVPPITTPLLTPPGNPADILRDWAQEMSDRTGVPLVAMLAYGYAELVVGTTTPQCNLSWTTLAAIGRVESNHGHSGDSVLASDGRAVPPIIGDPLDGQGGRQHIPDTDNGMLDGDTEYDRAVGPMQFIPETWRQEAVDATGDGVADIHNIHDAALAAANYLCHDGRDLSTATDWWAAVHAYNDVSVYAEAVFAAANEYGQHSRDG